MWYMVSPADVCSYIHMPDMNGMYAQLSERYTKWAHTNASGHPSSRVRRSESSGTPLESLPEECYGTR